MKAWKIRRFIVTTQVTAMLLSGMVSFDTSGRFNNSTAQAAVTLHNPTYDDGVQEVAPGTQDTTGKLHNPAYDAATDTAEWDCVWFGNYWQSDTNGDGVADEKDEKEPIKWRVLSVDGDDIFLLADKNLDVKPYNETYTDVTWETCTLRSWLNGYGSSQNTDGVDYTSGNFIDTAFTTAEQAAIQTTGVVNADNSKYGTEGGNNTKDKIFLPSIAEVSNPSYGFQGEFDEDTDTRKAMNTAYVGGHSDMSSVGAADCWWLRSPGDVSFIAAYVNFSGYGYYDGTYVHDDGYAIRPALHLTLSSSTPLTYGGTVHPNVRGTATWDCVYFGNYWQSDTNGDGVTDQNDEKEPIKWRVLSVDGDDVFLLADKNLDGKPYNTEYSGVTWETCTLRSWLNGYDGTKNDCGTDYTTDNFIDNAFSTTEQGAIKNTNVANEDNPYYGIEGGNNTTDKVYLLSIAEVSNPAYGFCHGYGMESNTRVALNTAYGEGNGGYTSSSRGSGWWWLRSPGAYDARAASVSSGGYGYGHGDDVDYDRNAIRPALHLTLSSSTPLTYVGTVCSDGTVTDADGDIVVKPTAKPTSTPAPGGTPTARPTVAPTMRPTAPPTSGTATKQPHATQAPAGPATQTYPAPGQVIKDTSSKAFYQIVSTGTANATVSYLRPENKMKKEKVPDTISYCGKKYKVTSIAKKAFAGNKKLKTVIIGKNVKTIEKNAFQNCKALQKVTVKSSVLTKVGKNALKGTNKRLTIKVPKKKKAKYKKLFKGKGNKKLQVK